MLKAAIFDFDGVIIDSESVQEEAWKRYLSKFNISFDKNLKKQVKGRTSIENMRTIFGNNLSNTQLAKKLKVKGYECVVFEDSIAGVEAAKKAGMKVVLVETSHKEKEVAGANLSIPNFVGLEIQKISLL